MGFQTHRFTQPKEEQRNHTTAAGQFIQLLTGMCFYGSYALLPSVTHYVTLWCIHITRLLHGWIPPPSLTLAMLPLLVRQRCDGGFIHRDNHCMPYEEMSCIVVLARTTHPLVHFVARGPC